MIENKYKPGMRVKHDEYGEGVITQIENETIYVKFESYAEEKYWFRYCSDLEPIRTREGYLSAIVFSAGDRSVGIPDYEQELSLGLYRDDVFLDIEDREIVRQKIKDLYGYFLENISVHFSDECNICGKPLGEGDHSMCSDW